MLATTDRGSTALCAMTSGCGHGAVSRTSFAAADVLPGQLSGTGFTELQMRTCQIGRRSPAAALHDLLHISNTYVKSSVSTAGGTVYTYIITININNAAVSPADSQTNC